MAFQNELKLTIRAILLMIRDAVVDILWQPEQSAIRFAGIGMAEQDQANIRAEEAEL